jgi:hypothetical protein
VILSFHPNLAGLCLAAAACSLCVGAFMTGGERRLLRVAVIGGLIYTVAGAALGNLLGLGIGVFLLGLCGWARRGGYGAPPSRPALGVRVTTSFSVAEVCRPVHDRMAALGHAALWEVPQGGDPAAVVVGSCAGCCAQVTVRHAAYPGVLSADYEPALTVPCRAVAW